MSPDDDIIEVGIIESDIRAMEGFIPANLVDSNHVVIWREGSIYYADYLSALIIEKNELKNNEFLCHYLTFEPFKPSNFRNWKYSSTYQLTLENTPFQYPLKQNTSFVEIDSIAFNCNCGEGIEANVYFMKDFGSNIVYPINENFNSEIVENIVKLFEQISKKEYIQTFALSNDSIDYQEISRLIHDSSDSYCINEE